jgi:hypothetical protein
MAVLGTEPKWKNTNLRPWIQSLVLKSRQTNSYAEEDWYVEGLTPSILECEYI